MLIVLQTTTATEKASEYLQSLGYPHDVIPIPESLGYKTGSNSAIYTEAPNQDEYAMALTRQRFIVMRVFKDFHLN